MYLHANSLLLNLTILPEAAHVSQKIKMPQLRYILVLFLLLWRPLATSSQSQYLLQQQHSKLELVQVLFRNGERTPNVDETYPGDPYADSSVYEPWGRGQLTELGRLRARRLGLALRRQYDGFLGTTYRPEDVYAYSVDRDSNRASLRLLIESLYKMGEKRSGPKIHSMPEDIDVLMNSRACSRYKMELDKVRRSAEVQKKLAKFEGLYRYIKEKAGVSFDNVSNAETLYKLYNLLEAQRSLNLTLPDWCPEGVLGLLNEMTFLHYNLESYTEVLRRLNGGPLVRRFLESMTRANPRAGASVHLYSGEDHNVAALARALNKRFPRVPNYGSAIVMEKRRSIESGRIYVRIMIWTGVTEKLFPIQLRGCMEMCPLEDYVKLIAEVLPTDEEMRCLYDDLRDRRYDRIIAY